MVQRFSHVRRSPHLATCPAHCGACRLQAHPLLYVVFCKIIHTAYIMLLIMLLNRCTLRAYFTNDRTCALSSCTNTSTSTRLLQRFRGHTSSVKAVEFKPDDPRTCVHTGISSNQLFHSPWLNPQLCSFASLNARHRCSHLS